MVENARDFMLRYHNERRAQIERNLNESQLFNKRFYTEDCEMGLLRVRHLQSLLDAEETIIEVIDTGRTTRVICSISDKTSETILLRYVLNPKQSTWEIRTIELRCPVCLGLPDNAECQVCSGNGWFGINKSLSVSKQLSNIPPSRLGRFW